VAWAVETEARDSSARRDRPLRYRPYLDGLRAVAVYLVVAFHARLGLLSGGFIGVDVFFVLSGFLVTRILMGDLASIGRIRARTFYSRRVRRILPASVTTLVVTALVYSIVATPAELLDALGGFRAAFFYVANWFFMRQSTDYFAANVNSSPVLHFWSLAIEEQFYLLWPLVLGGLYVVSGRAGRRRWWVVRVVVVVAAAASAIAALHVGSTNLNRAYYGTDTRAYELFAGALLALTPQLLHLGTRSRRFARWIAAVALGGLLVLATSAFDMSPITRGVLVAGLAPMLIIALENARRGLAKRMLSSQPFAYLGRISYGTYLWHWPVVVIVAHDHHPSPIQMFVISATTATVLAAVSFHLIEHPIRASHALDRFKVPIIAIGFATSILIGLAVPTIFDASGGAAARPRRAGTSAEQLVDWRIAKLDRAQIKTDCLDAPISKCTLWHGSKQRVLIIGDSHAIMLLPTFLRIAQEDALTLSIATQPGCPWQQGVSISSFVLTDCARRQTDWYHRLIPALHPDVVILATKGYDDPSFPLSLRLPDGRTMRFGSPEFEQGLIEASAASLRELRAPGRKIVLVEPTPVSWPFDPISCLSKGRAATSCEFRASPGPTPLERFYRDAAARSDVWSIDLDHLVCPRLPTCDAIVNDIIVRRDANSHLTATFARSIAPALEQILVAQGVLAAP
jgi:peptidoglycan/LPS O-acetylase OafA/YrhL